MAFTGKYVLEKEENLEEFLKTVGMKEEDLSHEAMITDMYQNDRFRLTKIVKDKTWNNQFIIGQESELQTEGGETFKVQTTVTLDAGKLKIQFPNYLYTAELQGDQLIEVRSTGAVSSTTTSRRMK